MDKLPKLVENHLGMRHLWYAEFMANHPVCKAFVLFGSHYALIDEVFASEEAKYWANDAGIYKSREVLKLEYKGVLIVPIESPSLILSANGEY
jgi:hypothetical protein